MKPLCPFCRGPQRRVLGTIRDVNGAIVDPSKLPTEILVSLYKWHCDNCEDPKKRPLLPNSESLPKLYHGTLASNLPRIRKEGLNPAHSRWLHDEPCPFVFLSPRIGVAENFASPEGGRGVIILIQLPKKLQRGLVTNLGEFVRCPFTIEPKYTRVVRYCR